MEEALGCAICRGLADLGGVVVDGEVVIVSCQVLKHWVPGGHRALHGSGRTWGGSLLLKIYGLSLN